MEQASREKLGNPHDGHAASSVEAKINRLRDRPDTKWTAEGEVGDVTEKDAEIIF